MLSLLVATGNRDGATPDIRTDMRGRGHTCGAITELPAADPPGPAMRLRDRSPTLGHRPQRLADRLQVAPPVMVGDTPSFIPLLAARIRAPPSTGK